MQENRASFIWDANEAVIEQSWQNLYEKITDTRDGFWQYSDRLCNLGIMAADFIGLLSYAHSEWSRKHRMIFSKITATATQEKDIKLLAEILAIMMYNPLATNIEGAWFIYYLAKESDLYGLDAQRAALVINELYKFNDYAAEVLMETLKTFVFKTQKGEERVCDLLQETGLLIKELFVIEEV